MADATVRVWQARLTREKQARRQAERALQEETCALAHRNALLEARVHELEQKLTMRSGIAGLPGDQTKSQFLATMSHELRTPLNAIIGFSEIMKAEILGPISPRYREYASNIHRSGSHLLALINDILDVSKLDAGKVELIDETVDVAAIVAECAALVEPQAVGSGVTLDAELPKGEYLLRADSRRLRQILLNLMSNAAKFTLAGGYVRVLVSTCKDGLSIAVADTGIGIAPEDIPRAFERFGQIDSTLARKYEGTGLGLPLARHLTELHGGRLDLESQVGVGTTITLNFPASRIVTQRETAAASGRRALALP
jgi:signal transduction histidine kinase